MSATVSKKMGLEEELQHMNKHEGDHEDCDSHDESDEEGEELEGEQTLNRNEKKARKILSKVGMKLVPGIERVTIKRGRVIFAIASPTVYVTPQGQYVVFGEAKLEDSGLQAQALAAQRLAAQRQNSPDAAAGEENAAEAEEEVPVDATGVDEKDVKLIMEQANVSRSRAVKALKDNDNDIVNAIMELTNM